MLNVMPSRELTEWMIFFDYEAKEADTRKRTQADGDEEVIHWGKRDEDDDGGNEED